MSEIQNTSWQLPEHVVIINRLEGYRNNQPQWGERLGMWHAISGETAILNREAWGAVDRSFGCEGLEPLFERNFLMANGERLNEVVFPNPMTHAEMFLQLTTACNFGCDGCNVGLDQIPGQKISTLSETEIEVILKSFFRSAKEKGINSLGIKYAGGEPTLARPWQRIMAVQDIVEQCRSEFPEIDVEQKIITNGSLLDDTKIKFLADHDVFTAVGFWAYGDEMNDQFRRPVQKYTGSFSRACNAIKNLRKADVRCNPAIVLSPYFPESYANFIECFWDIESDKHLYADEKDKVKPVVPMSVVFYRARRPGDNEALVKEQNEMVRGLRMGFAKILELINEDVPIPELRRIDYLTPYSTGEFACTSGWAYIAAGPKGVVPCHEELADPPLNFDRIRTGENMFDVANDLVRTDRDMYKASNIKFPDNESGKLFLAGGSGCPRQAAREHDGVLGYPSSALGIYAQIYKEFIALEMMRMKNMEFS